MKKIEATRKHELTAYLIIWLAVFITPAVSRLVEAAGVSVDYDWKMVFRAWRDFVPFFLLFWLHDLFVAPLLTRRNRFKLYLPCSALLITLFMLITCSGLEKQHPAFREHPHTPPRAMQYRQGPPQSRRDFPRKHEGSPLVPITLIDLALMVAMCGLNIGVKLYFKSQREERDREELKKRSLQHELEYLKFQINPHFFMNTLNNIHALVDIAPERAKQAIIELSVLMRYILYEANSEKVPLARELEFLKHYIDLMRLRFTEKVEITTCFPSETQNLQIPPLVYATFVENAFKHGISYLQKSYVDVRIEIQAEHILFVCRNTVRPAREQHLANQRTIDGKRVKKRKGIGLENVRKRLTLIYQNHYDLRIQPSAAAYEVSLLLPIAYD